MEIEINNALKELNKLFLNHNTKLYVVGGFVRDSLLSVFVEDIDICSSLTNDELFKMLENTPFEMKLGSKKLGTSIICFNDAKFEHTTFRTEAYLQGGFHTPQEVTFVTNIKEDAKRRDFTINALYYDIQEDKIIDYFNGLSDLKKKMVKAILNPDHVFKSDGLRILRMVRIANYLNFKIERHTKKTAKKWLNQLNDVTKDRLFKEFEIILNTRPKEQNKGLETLLKLGALPYIFKGLQNNKNIPSLKRLHKNLFYVNLVTKEELKLPSFVLDFSLYVNKRRREKLSVIATHLLNQDTCGVSVNQKKQTISLIKAYEQSLKLKEDSIVKKFLQDHVNILPSLFEFLNNVKDQKTYEVLKRNYDYMKEHKMPFTLKELAINGNVLLKEMPQLEKTQISSMLESALKFTTESRHNNNKKKLMDYLKNR